METPLHDLAGCHVLLVEDEYFIADDLAQRLSAHGAVLLGPAPTLEQALALVQEAERIDGAVIDINLPGQMAFLVAEVLEERDVPFVFATGYDAPASPIAISTFQGGKDLWSGRARAGSPGAHLSILNRVSE